MRPENKRMKEFLASNGVTAHVKWIPDGSLKNRWRFYNPDQKWTLFLAAQLTSLGFTDFDNKPLGIFSGNGGMFCVFVRGHEDMAK
jgi:hypothetical protein